MPDDKPTQSLGKGPTLPLRWYQRPIPKSVAVGIGIATLYIIAGMNMPWWATSIVWCVLWIMLLYLIFLSPWTFNFALPIKIVFSLLAAILTVSLSQNAIREQFREAYPTPAPTPTPTPLPTPANIGVLAVPSEASHHLNRSIEFGDSGAVFWLMNNEDEEGKTQMAHFLDMIFKGMALRIKSSGSALKVSADIRDDGGHIIAQITDNEWKSKPENWDRNYTDDALEVKNAFGHVVLQIKVLPDRIQLQAEGWDEEGNNGIRVTKARDQAGTINGALVILDHGHRCPELSIKQIFEYPSEVHFHQLHVDLRKEADPLPQANPHCRIMIIPPGNYGISGSAN